MGPQCSSAPWGREGPAVAIVTGKVSDWGGHRPRARAGHNPSPGCSSRPKWPNLLQPKLRAGPSPISHSHPGRPPMTLSTRCLSEAHLSPHLAGAPGGQDCGLPRPSLDLAQGRLSMLAELTSDGNSN